MGRQKSGISMTSLQRMLEIGSYKTVWTMGYKIRKAISERDAQYELDGNVFGADCMINKHYRSCLSQSYYGLHIFHLPELLFRAVSLLTY
jgi:hypothetical protein